MAGANSELQTRRSYQEVAERQNFDLLFALTAREIGMHHIALDRTGANDRERR
jgi:hypothetical protein